MPKAPHEHREGFIRGLRLPSNAWYVLRRENITTIHRLKAVADQLERFRGIGPATAQAIREELARVWSLEEHPPDDSQPPPQRRDPKK
jgi:hypothetical protein